jgi:transcriptional regulator with XRE-family HTH domain
MEVIIGKCLLPRLLKQSHMTSTDLSIKTGISIHQLSTYINNKRMMSLGTAMLIADTLDCYIDDLYQWKVIK